MFAFAFECLCLVFSLVYLYLCPGHCLLGPAMPIHPKAHALCIAPCPPPLHNTWHSSLQIKPFHWIACGSSNVLLWTIIRCFQHVSLRRCLQIWAAFSVPVQVLQCLREPIKKPSAFFSVCHRPSIEKTASEAKKNLLSNQRVPNSLSSNIYSQQNGTDLDTRLKTGRFAKLCRFRFYGQHL